MIARGDLEVDWYIDHLPTPPTNYRFSQRQRFEQYYFFKLKLDLWTLPRQVDIYKASIVIACKSTLRNITFPSTSLFSLVPEYVSSSILHFVQALLVTHTECKLNTTTAQLPSHFERSSNWCDDLEHPSLSDCRMESF